MCVRVQYGQQFVRLPLVIVEGEGPCPFGLNWLEAIKLDCPPICQVSARPQVEPILAEFQEVFEDGMGCYRGDPVHIGVHSLSLVSLMPGLSLRRTGQMLTRRLTNKLVKVSGSRWLTAGGPPR